MFHNFTECKVLPTYEKKMEVDNKDESSDGKSPEHNSALLAKRP
jgi:hypothetical protein